MWNVLNLIILFLNCPFQNLLRKYTNRCLIVHGPIRQAYNNNNEAIDDELTFQLINYLTPIVNK